VFNLNWWNGADHPFGGPFTLSPENYSYWTTPAWGRDNYYLGYSLEKTCLQTQYIPYPERPRTAYIISKFLQYFLANDYILPAESGLVEDQVKSDFYNRVSRDVNVTFLANFKHDVKVDPPAGITELPWLDRPTFQDLVAHTRAVMGVGWPLLSPTPWEALCLGVPFINPIKYWDTNHPEDRTKWVAQQDGILYLGVDEPYVYHVKKGNSTGLERAIRLAMETPIDRFIPPHMKMHALIDRVRRLLETDWAPTARQQITIAKEKS